LDLKTIRVPRSKYKLIEKSIILERKDSIQLEDIFRAYRIGKIPGVGGEPFPGKMKKTGGEMTDDFLRVRLSKELEFE